MEEIKKHHRIRLEEIRNIIQKKPAGAYEIAAGLTWSLRGADWDRAPEKQKWFAVGETLAHLEYLMGKGEVIREERETDRGIQHFYILK